MKNLSYFLWIRTLRIVFFIPASSSITFTPCLRFFCTIVKGKGVKWILETGMISSYSSQSFRPSMNRIAIKKLQHETPYLKTTYNMATIYRIDEGENPTILNFISLCSVMNYFISLEYVKITKVQVWLIRY